MAEVDWKAVERVRFMETAMDAVQCARNQNDGAALDTPAVRTSLRQLAEYMDSGQWLRDYELDEAGGLPPDLKRGVLAQDALYDLLAETRTQEL